MPMEPHFPRGQISQDDEGEVTLAIYVWRNVVRIDFAEPTTWLGVPPDQARELGRILIKRADEIEARQG